MAKPARDSKLRSNHETCKTKRTLLAVPYTSQDTITTKRETMESIVQSVQDGNALTIVDSTWPPNVGKLAMDSNRKVKSTVHSQRNDQVYGRKTTMITKSVRNQPVPKREKQVLSNRMANEQPRSTILRDMKQTEASVHVLGGSRRKSDRFLLRFIPQIS